MNCVSVILNLSFSLSVGYLSKVIRECTYFKEATKNKKYNILQHTTLVYFIHVHVS